MQRLRFVIALCAAITMALASAATAHPDHGGQENAISYEEEFAGEGVEQDKQHDGDDGHLPAVQRNVDLVGKVAVDDRGAGTTGRIADVAAYGDYAYLNAFRDPSCQEGGVHVIDISDPTNPVEVVDAFMPTSAGSYAGEGVKILPIAGMDVLIHQNETCAFDANVPSGGINLWDVSDPTNPVLLADHEGDTDLVNVAYLDGSANDSHSFDAWTNDFTGRTYAALIDNFETTDVDILDITDPTSPVMVNDTLDLVEATQQDAPANLTSVFSHDMDVQRFGSRYVMSLNYWDGGYVLLDVTDPAGAFVIAQSEYAALDEERLARGHEISPEGNAHQSEMSPDGRFLLGTDEDFNPFRIVATIDSGRHAGAEFVATQGTDVPQLQPGQAVQGTPTFVGMACEALPAGSGIALIERGVCAFTVKVQNAQAAGYSAGIVFNSLRSDCLSLVNMIAEGDIPFLFVNRLVGLQMLGQDVTAETACTAPTPADGSPTAAISIASVFDGWGYVRLFRTQFPLGGTGTGSITQVGTYAIPESQDQAFGIGFGDLSVHEVAMDPRPGSYLAYISYYSGGLRVVEYGNDGIREVGAFIDEGGNNFWGVEVHDIGGRQYILASDRDHGLYIFDYTGEQPQNLGGRP